MWVNLIGFNLLWAGLVLLGDVFVVVAVLALFAHFNFCQNRQDEAKVILAVAVIGCTVDSLLTYFNVFIFPHALIPLWLVALWLCFAATIRHSLSFLASVSWYWQAMVGACFAPLSYFAGERLGAVAFSLPYITTFVLLSAIWALLMVLFFNLNAKISSGDNANVTVY